MGNPHLQTHRVVRACFAKSKILASAATRAFRPATVSSVPPSVPCLATRDTELDRTTKDSGVFFFGREACF